jgi:hypothetical protein
MPVEQTLIGGKSLFIFYLIISSNFMINLFGCRIQYLFTHNMYLRHLLGFFVVYFFVSLDEPSSIIPLHPTKRMLFSLLVYIWFLITTRMSITFWIPFIVLLTLVYVVQIYKEYETKQKTPDDVKIERMRKAQLYILGFVGLLTIIGFIHYLGGKKYEYGNKFSYRRFIFEKPSCNDHALHMNGAVNLFDSIKLALFNIPVQKK